MSYLAHHTYVTPILLHYLDKTKVLQMFALLPEIRLDPTVFLCFSCFTFPNGSEKGISPNFGGGRFVTSPPVGDNFIGLCKIGIGSWIETQVLFHFYFNNTKNMRHSKNFAPLFGQKKCSANFCSVTGNSVGSGCVSLFLVFYISQRE